MASLDEKRNDDKRNLAIGIGVAAGMAALAGGLYWWLQTSKGQVPGQPSQASGYNFTISASSSTVGIGQPDIISVSLMDAQTNQPVANVPIQLYDITNPSNPILLTSGTTDANGHATLTVEWSNAGTYTIQAQAYV